jgi:hypothetical protein
VRQPWWPQRRRSITGYWLRQLGRKFPASETSGDYEWCSPLSWPVSARQPNTLQMLPGYCLLSPSLILKKESHHPSSIWLLIHVLCGSVEFCIPPQLLTLYSTGCLPSLSTSPQVELTYPLPSSLWYLITFTKGTSPIYHPIWHLPESFCQLCQGLASHEPSLSILLPLSLLYKPLQDYKPLFPLTCS